MTKSKAIQKARMEANQKGWPYTVWIAEPGCYIVTAYLQSDEPSDQFVCKVDPEV